MGKSGVKWVWTKYIFTIKSRKNLLFNIFSCVNIIYNTLYTNMSLKFNIDFSNWTQQELIDLSRAQSIHHRRTAGQDIEFLEQDISKVNAGFPNKPQQASEWSKQAKNTDEN